MKIKIRTCEVSDTNYWWHLYRLHAHVRWSASDS